MSEAGASGTSIIAFCAGSRSAVTPRREAGDMSFAPTHIRVIIPGIFWKWFTGQLYTTPASHPAEVSEATLTFFFEVTNLSDFETTLELLKSEQGPPQISK